MQSFEHFVRIHTYKINITFWKITQHEPCGQEFTPSLSCLTLSMFKFSTGIWLEIIQCLPVKLPWTELNYYLPFKSVNWQILFFVCSYVLSCWLFTRSYHFSQFNRTSDWHIDRVLSLSVAGVSTYAVSAQGRCKLLSSDANLCFGKQVELFFG